MSGASSATFIILKVGLFCDVKTGKACFTIVKGTKNSGPDTEIEICGGRHDVKQELSMIRERVVF
jgi:hypothetical protein